MPIKFSDLRSGYPTGSRQQLFDALGGEWPSLIDNPNYQNTCAVRLSIALKSAGLSVPNAFREAVSGGGTNIILKVSTMGNFLRQELAQSYWGMSKQPGTALTPGAIPNVTGIIVYHAAWSDATGHFDLWDGTGFVGNGSFRDIRDGFDLELWRVT